MSCLSTALITGADGRWRPGIGDPTVMGWLTAAAYFAAAVLAYRAFLRGRREIDASADLTRPPAMDRLPLVALWGVTAAVMFLLGINKQLDLQTWLTQTLRDTARANGWYEQRRYYQVFAMAAMGLGCGCAIALSLFLLRRVWRQAIGAVVGLSLVVVFVLIRASSFHRVDIFLGRGTVRMNWVLELGAIAIVAWSAYQEAYRKRRLLEKEGPRRDSSA